MKWHDKIGNRIVVLNLSHREDRLLEFTEQAEKYSIPFLRIESIHDKESGARGLRDTILKLFNEEILNETKHLLVFEDDAECVVPPEEFNSVMEKVIDQLPGNYHMVFLGGQLTNRISHFHSENLIPVQKFFATHAVLYSLEGMKAVVASNLGYPIDNHLVEAVQPLGGCYCVYPLLFGQRPGMSDIYNNFIDWSVFIQGRYEQKIVEYKQGLR